jgi:hypothetical protein
VEFVEDREVMELLRECRVIPVPADGERVYLQMSGDDDVVRVHLSTGKSAAEPAPGAEVLTVPPDRLADKIDGILHKLGLSQILLVPVGKWRYLFDAVAFSLAQNEDWQEIEAMATVERNSRDPLLCDPGDFHTVAALIRALLADADRPEQGLMITTTGAPLLVEIVPDGAARLSFGNRVLADEALEAINV